jgi:hypothetical protein
MGSGLEKVDVIYDTGSHWLAIDTDLCANCTALDGTYFNTASSTTFNIVDSDTSTDGIQYNTLAQKYDNANYTGYEATDRAAIDSAGTYKVSSMTFFAITDVSWKTEAVRYEDLASKAHLNKDYDGFLGLSRQFTPGSTVTNGPLWLN